MFPPYHIFNSIIPYIITKYFFFSYIKSKIFNLNMVFNKKIYRIKKSYNLIYYNKININLNKIFIK